MRRILVGDSSDSASPLALIFLASLTVALPNGLPKLGRNSIRIATQNSVRKILVFLHADKIIQRMNAQAPRARF